MKKLSKVIVLLISIMLFFMQPVIEAKYVLSYTNEIAKIYIDNVNPTIEGVEEDGKYNQDVKVTYYDNTKIKNAVYYYNSEIKNFDVEPQTFESGHMFTEEGYYKILVTDIYNNQTQIETFLIDKTAPQILGVENGIIYDLPPNVEYYDKYGIEKIEITTEEELELEYQYKNSNQRPLSDRTSSTLTVHVSYAPKSAMEYKWYIKKETEKEYQLIESNLENQFTFTNLESETRYNIYCIASTSDNKSYMSNIITAQTITDVEKVEIIEVTSSGYKIKVTQIAKQYQYIYLPTWSDENGQDDIIWYKYNIIDYDECVFEIDYNNHNKETGKYKTHIYLEEDGKDRRYVQTLEVWVGEDEPTHEETEVKGNVGITVTDKAGNQSKVEYFIDEIVNICLSKTYGKDEYFELKKILAGKMESFDDSTYTIKIKQSNLDSIKKLEITNFIDEDNGYFEGIYYFRNLEYLDISGSTKYKMEDLSTLTNLKYLDISNCKSNFTYNLAFLNQLPNLEYLNTTGTNITNEEVIQTLPNLKEWKN